MISPPLFLMADVFSRGPWDFQTTLTLAVFAQLRKYATIVRGLCAAVRGCRHDNRDDLSSSGDESKFQRGAGVPTRPFRLDSYHTLAVFYAAATTAGSFDPVTSLLAHHRPDWLSLAGFLYSWVLNSEDWQVEPGADPFETPLTVFAQFFGRNPC